MKSFKQTAINAISKMPDIVKADDVMYKLYLIDKIMKGEKDMKEGKYVNVDMLKKEIEQW